VMLVSSEAAGSSRVRQFRNDGAKKASIALKVCMADRSSTPQARNSDLIGDSKSALVRFG
jgi:hypothetical protein